MSAPGHRDAPDTGADPRPASSGPAGSVSPLDTYLLPRSLLEPGNPTVVLDREDEVERQVAACMAARGFDYVPLLGRSSAPAPAGPGPDEPGPDEPGPDEPGPDELGADEPEPDTRAWAQRWGYGIATAPPTVAIDDEDRDVDPNHAVVAALDPGRRRAYQRALYGRAFDDVPEDGEATADDTAGAPTDLDAACRTIAVRAVYGWTPAHTFTWPDGIDPWADRARIHDEAMRDPRVVAALADWSRRMADAGHPGYTDPDGPAAAVAARRTRIDDDVTELARLARSEVALAVADWDARAASRVVAIMVAVRWEREREYIEAHRGALDAYRATMDDASHRVPDPSVGASASPRTPRETAAGNPAPVVETWHSHG